MPRVRLTRTVRFEAVHRLHDPALSEDENRALFGWTMDPHPHDYRIAVTVAGAAAGRRAMVMDLAHLDGILAEEVSGRLAGMHLHRDVEAFQAVLPTCEAIARDVFHRVARRLPADVTLERVLVAEDDTLSAECLPDL